MQTHIPKICSDFLQNYIDKRMFEIYNKFTVKEQMFANICFESMGGIYYDERIQRKDNCYTKHSQKCTPRKMSYQKNKMQTFPFASMFLICLATVAVLRFTSVDANADVPERYKYYTNVYVDRDTTLWGVSQKYISDEYTNIRAYMEEVKSINHLPDDQLIYGTTICVPYYSDEYRQ